MSEVEIDRASVAQSLNLLASRRNSSSMSIRQKSDAQQETSQLLSHLASKRVLQTDR